MLSQKEDCSYTLICVVKEVLACAVSVDGDFGIGSGIDCGKIYVDVGCKSLDWLQLVWSGAIGLVAIGGPGAGVKEVLRWEVLISPNMVSPTASHRVWGWQARV